MVFDSPRCPNSAIFILFIKWAGDFIPIYFSGIKFVLFAILL
jgi:hypothetical protein